MVTDTSIIPVHGTDSNDTPATLRALAAVVQPYVTNPAAQTLGECLSRLAAGSPADAVYVVHQNQRTVLGADQAASKAGMRAITATMSTLLTPSNPGNGTHEVTPSGDALTDLFGAEGAAQFSANCVTARKPRKSIGDLVDEVDAAAKLNGAPVLQVVDRLNATVRVFKGTPSELDAQLAAVIAIAHTTGVFAEISGTEVPSSGSLTVYLSV